MSRTTAPADREARTRLRELVGLFLRLGATSFGGPAAHIAMMHEEVVRRRHWLRDEQFLDLVGAVHLIPGPNSTELAIHIGWARRRWSGLVAAGLAFVLPAMLLAGLCGWAYVEFHALPAVHWLLYGVKPVMLAVVVQAMVTMAPKAVRSPRLGGLAALAIAATAVGAHELLVLAGAGLSTALPRFARSRRPGLAALPLALPLAPTAVATATAAVSLGSLFAVFLKAGALLFGSGYVLLSFLRGDLVERLGWLSEAQLVDAIAVGQVTPGPVFTTATFVGYVLAGPAGALVATVGIFLPAFVFVALSGPLVPKLRASPVAGALLDGVNVASFGLLVVVTAQLAAAAFVDLPTVALGAIAAALLLRWRPNATWLLLGGGALGAALHWLRLA